MRFKVCVNGKSTEFELGRSRSIASGEGLDSASQVCWRMKPPHTMVYMEKGTPQCKCVESTLYFLEPFISWYEITLNAKGFLYVPRHLIIRVKKQAD